MWFFVIIVSYPVCCNAPRTDAPKTLSLRACEDSSSDECDSSLMRDLLNISKDGRLSASPLLSLNFNSFRYVSKKTSTSPIDASWCGLDVLESIDASWCWLDVLESIDASWCWLDVLGWLLNSPIDSSGLWCWLDVLGWLLNSPIYSSGLWCWLDVLAWPIKSPIDSSWLDVLRWLDML